MSRSPCAVGTLPKSIAFFECATIWHTHWTMRNLTSECRHSITHIPSLIDDTSKAEQPNMTYNCGAHESDGVYCGYT